MFQAEGSNKSNQVFQFVPGLTALHRTALSPLRSAKAAAEQRRYVVNFRHTKEIGLHG